MIPDHAREIKLACGDFMLDGFTVEILREKVWSVVPDNSQNSTAWWV